MWGQLLGIAAAILILFLLVRTIRNQPELFSRKNFAKSGMTMGLLALGLMAFIAFCILLLKSG